MRAISGDLGANKELPHRIDRIFALIYELASDHGARAVSAQKSLRKNNSLARDPQRGRRTPAQGPGPGYVQRG